MRRFLGICISFGRKYLELSRFLKEISGFSLGTLRFCEDIQDLQDFSGFLEFLKMF